MATPIQAVGIPQFSSVSDEIRKINQAKKADIDPPRVIALTGGADVIFDCRENGGDNKPVSKLILHNLGANPMYYALNMAVDNKLGTFHDILAGGSAIKDGLGSQVDLSKDQPDFVTVKGTAGEWLAVVISYSAQ